MEAGGAMLDESLALFEEGIKLVKLCQSALEGAEQKVKLLQKNDEAEEAAEE
jgi:exodeoxyribonuclease VII small subunit